MWFWYSLLSAILSAISIIINKKALAKINPLTIVWALHAVPILFLAPLVFFHEKPQVSTLFYVGVFGSAIVFFFSKTLSLHSIKDSILSRVIPLTALTGFFSYLFGLLFLGESVRLIPIIGIFVTIVGTYLFNLERRESLFEPFLILWKNKNARLFVASLVLTSIASIFDKTALNNSAPVSPYFTYLMENIIVVIPLTLYLFSSQKNFFTEVRTHTGMLISSGLIYGLMGILVFSGFATAPIVLVVAIKKIQILFVFLFSYLLFKDKPTRYTYIGTLIMLFGVILMKIG